MMRNGQWSYVGPVSTKALYDDPKVKAALEAYAESKTPFDRRRVHNELCRADPKLKGKTMARDQWIESSLVRLKA